MDAGGRVCVTGGSYGDGTSSDYATIMYDSLGNQLWVARYDGPARGEDRANALAVDGAGNVYVTGHSEGETTFLDYATIKYDREGNELWVMRYDGPKHQNDFAVDLAVDATGGIYVTGFSEGIGTEDDYATIKYQQTAVAIGGRAARGGKMPRSLALGPAYPNPFNPAMVIPLTLPEGLAPEQGVAVAIFSLRGQRVRTLWRDHLPPGRRVVVWDGRDDAGRPAPSGVYIGRLEAGPEVRTTKLLLAR